MADLTKISQNLIDGKAPVVKQLVTDAIAEGVPPRQSSTMPSLWA